MNNKIELNRTLTEESLPHYLTELAKNWHVDLIWGLPLPIRIERTIIPLYCIFRNYFEIDNVFQRSIKLLVGILIEVFTPAKLTEIQRRISLLPHLIEACHSA